MPNVLVGTDGIVTVNAPLNIRSGAPSLSAPIALKVGIGSQLRAVGVVPGDSIGGNSRWYAGQNNTFFWSGVCTSAAGSALASCAINCLAGTVENAPPASFGFDIAQPVTPSSAAGYLAKGYKFCVRYLARGPAQGPDNLSRAEAEAILDAGLALMAVQHVTPRNWIPSQVLGTEYGTNAASNAKMIGLPPGMNVWLDLEGIRPDVPGTAVLDYCNAWFTAVEAGGYTTGIYVGDSIVISGDDLYWNLRTRHYWKSGSRVPDIPHRGYQMIQSISGGNAEIDSDFTQNDLFGECVQWLTRRTLA